MDTSKRTQTGAGYATSGACRWEDTQHFKARNWEEVGQALAPASVRLIDITRYLPTISLIRISGPSGK